MRLARLVHGHRGVRTREVDAEVPRKSRFLKQPVVLKHKVSETYALKHSVEVTSRHNECLQLCHAIRCATKNKGTVLGVSKFVHTRLCARMKEENFQGATGCKTTAVKDFNSSHFAKFRPTKEKKRSVAGCGLQVIM